MPRIFSPPHGHSRETEEILGCQSYIGEKNMILHKKFGFQLVTVEIVFLGGE